MCLFFPASLLTGAMIVQLLRRPRVLVSGATMPSLGTDSECCSSLRDILWLYLEECGALFPGSTWMADLEPLIPVYIATTRSEKEGPG